MIITQENQTGSKYIFLKKIWPLITKIEYTSWHLLSNAESYYYLPPPPPNVQGADKKPNFPTCWWNVLKLNHPACKIASNKHLAKTKITVEGWKKIDVDHCNCNNL